MTNFIFYVRLRVFVESAFIGVVSSAVGLLAFLHGVFPASVPLDDAHNDEHKKQEGDSQHHADEPPCGRDVLPGLNDRAFSAGSVDFLHVALHVVRAVYGDDGELVQLAWFQSLDHHVVFVQLRGRLQPRGFALLAVLDEEVRAGALKVW